MRDRPANPESVRGNEMQITPAMIEAGVEHLYRYHPDRGVNAERTVSAIFFAMLRVAPLELEEERLRTRKPHP